MERDKLKEKLSWNEIRNLILNIKSSKRNITAVIAENASGQIQDPEKFCVPGTNA